MYGTNVNFYHLSPHDTIKIVHKKQDPAWHVASGGADLQKKVWSESPDSGSFLFVTGPIFKVEPNGIYAHLPVLPFAGGPT